MGSRWRDAVGHVQRLKRELAVQREATAKANQKLENVSQSPSNQQHQQTPPMTPSGSGSMVIEESPAAASSSAFDDVTAEMNRMDRILAAHQSPPKQAGGSNHGTPRISTSPVVSTPPSNTARSTESFFPETTDDNDEMKTQAMDQAVTPSPERRDYAFELAYNDDIDIITNKRVKNDKGEDFFAMFTKGDTKVDLGDLEEEEDDPPLYPPPTVTPSESPPPSPPPAEATDTTTTTTSDYETINGPFLPGASQSTDANTSSLFPVTASPKLMAGSKVYNESFPGEISAEIIRHPRSAERKMLPDFNDIEEETSVRGERKIFTDFNDAEEETTAPSSAPTSTTSSSSLSSSSKMSSQEKAMPPAPPLSGMDAFETSFATKFPESFSPASKDKATTKETTTEAYNPFFPSPMKGPAPSKQQRESSPTTSDAGSTFTSSSSRYGNDGQARRGQADNAPSPVEGRRPSYRSNYANANNAQTNRSSWRDAFPSTVNDSPISTQTPSPNRYDQTGAYTNNSSPPEDAVRRDSGARRFATPPHGHRSPELVPGSEEPKRPEKAGAVAARARYEKALQPRAGFQANTRRFPRKSSSEVNGTTALGGPPSESTMVVTGFAPTEKATDHGSAQANTSSELARAQARLKERTSGYTGRPTNLSALESRTYSSIREKKAQQPWAGPSPTDSLGSKPWDEIGDIPMEPSPIKNGKTSPPSNGNRYTQRALARNRPWDKTAKEQQPVDAATQPLLQVQQKGSFDDESPPSRFVAAGKSRRSVKQPVSYAEPSLGSKLRRGDVYFAKKDVKDSDENQTYPATAVHL